MIDAKMQQVYDIEELGGAFKKPNLLQSIRDGHAAGEVYADAPGYWQLAGITEAEFNAAQKAYMDSLRADKFKELNGDE